MTVSITVYNADGSTLHFFDLPMPEQPVLADFRDYITPYFDEPFEHVTVFWNGEYTDMFVGETSALRGLPVNEMASKIYNNNLVVHDPSNPRAGTGTIYGTAVLFSRRVWF